MEKKSNRWKKILGYSSFVLVLLLAIAIWKSPFQDGVIEHTVEVEAPLNEVYDFLSNSNNAKRWSVFVDHINTLNADSITDGKVGSRRRCFCKADETGTQWDELISEVEPYQRRQLLIYNLKEFSMTADNLATNQFYETLPGDRCKLTFTVFFKGDQPGIWDWFKTKLAAYKIQDIFERNMDNIKRIVEEEHHAK
jgi:uncharacterized protein YndB with AHSA1/START domain